MCLIYPLRPIAGVETNKCSVVSSTVQFDVRSGEPVSLVLESSQSTGLITVTNSRVSTGLGKLGDFATSDLHLRVLSMIFRMLEVASYLTDASCRPKINMATQHRHPVCP